MLEHEIQENEEKWLNYEEELTEVCVEMADIVFESMLDEASEELFTILLREKAKIKWNLFKLKQHTILLINKLSINFYENR